MVPVANASAAQATRVAAQASRSSTRSPRRRAHRPLHLVGYAILAVLASRVIGRGRRGLFLAVGAAVAFGFGIELLQAPIPWRSFAWSDAAVNAIGAVVGLVAVVAVNAIGAIVATAERRPR